VCQPCLDLRRRRSLDRQNARDYRPANLRKYGTTVAGYEALLIFQGSRCALCFTDEPGGQGMFHVDHCHVSGQIRGLLCARCNVGIGMLRENLAVLVRARAYLQQPHLR